MFVSLKFLFLHPKGGPTRVRHRLTSPSELPSPLPQPCPRRHQRGAKSARRPETTDDVDGRPENDVKETGVVTWP